MFECFAVVPDRALEWPATWRLQFAEGVEGAAMPFGLTPTVEVSEADPPANAGPERPRVLRTRFTLRGAGREARCHVDRSLVSALQPRDIIHFARTRRGGLGLSVLRNQRLVVAVGAVTAVPLGEDVGARVAPDRHDEALRLLEPPDSLEPWDPYEWHGHEWPVEIRIGDIAHVFLRRNQEIKGVQVFMVHGFYVAASPHGRRHDPERGLERDECLALTRTNQCSAIGANASAFLLDIDGLEAS